MPVKPTEKEEEYFARIEMEKRKKAEGERAKLLEASEKKRLSNLHYMHCPKCGMTLQEIEYKGVRIDKCFQCDGIWLDTGELQMLSKLEQPSMNKVFKLFGK